MASSSRHTQPSGRGESEVPNPSTQESQNTSRRRQIKSRGSEIFTKHFHCIETDDGLKDVCNYCKAEYVHSGGYGNLDKHMRREHKNELGIDDSQTQLSRFGKSSGAGSSSQPTSQLFKYSDVTNREELAKFICMEHLSFSFGEKMTFTNYVHKALQPAACRSGRNTTKRYILNMFKNGKESLFNMFKEFKGRVAICSDIWSDHFQTHSYMGVTCHWIDESWTIQKRIIAFRVFDDPHTAHNIYLWLSTILHEYDLLHKVLTIGFDNASANTASINELKAICQPNMGGKFFHIRCACHVLNLCVQDGLQSLKTFISPIKDALNLIWSHKNIRREWYNFCKNSGISPKKFPRDVPTRWNSTYVLLNESYEYKDYLCRFISQNHQHICLYPSHWDVCGRICNILKVFSDATNSFSGVYYPTSNIFMLECLNIAGTLHEIENSDDDDNAVLFECIILMRQKWLNYFREIPSLYLVATVLDPRFKLEGLEHALQCYYEFLSIRTIDVSIIINDVKNNLVDLFTDFASRNSIETSTSGEQSVSEPSKLPSGHRWLFQRSKKPRAATTNYIEIDKYLTTTFEIPPDTYIGSQFDILDWWHRHQGLFPVLALIAKEILASPVSTVAVEQAFSAGGNILDVRRSTLHPSSLEAQVCVDDWSRAELRQQQSEPNDFEDLIDDTDTGSSTRTGPPTPEDEI